MNVRIKIYQPGDSAIEVERGRLTALGYSVTVLNADEGLECEDIIGSENHPYQQAVILIATI
ncbi:MAG TPA: hypothetical protein VNI58_10715 [Mariprofundaceae bacterium]|nr:hypothetical protein [Mariprofundaceae bacterium]